MRASLRHLLGRLTARGRRCLTILRACLRHLADEDAWERYRSSARRAADEPAHGPGCRARTSETIRASDTPADGPDRGRFWQEETERRWNGIRRCC